MSKQLKEINKTENGKRMNKQSTNSGNSGNKTLGIQTGIILASFTNNTGDRRENLRY